MVQGTRFQLRKRQVQEGLCNLLYSVHEGITRNREPSIVEKGTLEYSDMGASTCVLLRTIYDAIHETTGYTVHGS